MLAFAAVALAQTPASKAPRSLPMPATTTVPTATPAPAPQKPTEAPPEQRAAYDKAFQATLEIITHEGTAQEHKETRTITVRPKLAEPIKVTLTGGYRFDGLLFPSGGEYVASGGGPLGLFPFSYQPGYVTLTNSGPFVRIEVKY